MVVWRIGGKMLVWEDVVGRCWWEDLGGNMLEGRFWWEDVGRKMFVGRCWWEDVGGRREKFFRCCTLFWLDAIVRIACFQSNIIKYINRLTTFFGNIQTSKTKL